MEQAPPDLIILDIWLQGSRMDGIEILKAVKRDNPGIPVVIISGHGNIEVAVAAVKQGAYDFIEKPFNMDQLMVVVGRALEASRLRRENARLRQLEERNAAHRRLVARHRRAARQARARRPRRQPADADGRPRQRQGGGGALRPRPFRPARRALRRGQRRLDRSGPDGGGAVRPRGRRAGARPASSSARMAARSSSTRSATCRRARSPRSCAC